MNREGKMSEKTLEHLNRALHAGLGYQLHDAFLDGHELTGGLVPEDGRLYQFLMHPDAHLGHLTLHPDTGRVVGVPGELKQDEMTGKGLSGAVHGPGGQGWWYSEPSSVRGNGRSFHSEVEPRTDHFYHMTHHDLVRARARAVAHAFPPLADHEQHLRLHDAAPTKLARQTPQSRLAALDPEEPVTPYPELPYPHMHPEYASFFQTIKNAPDKRLHAAIFADWLDDHGHSHAAEILRNAAVHGHILIHENLGGGGKPIRGEVFPSLEVGRDSGLPIATRRGVKDTEYDDGLGSRPPTADAEAVFLGAHEGTGVSAIAPLRHEKIIERIESGIPSQLLIANGGVTKSPLDRKENLRRAQYRWGKGLKGTPTRPLWKGIPESEKTLRLARTSTLGGWITPDGTFHENKRAAGHWETASNLGHREVSEAYAAGWAHVADEDKAPGRGFYHMMYHPEGVYTGLQIAALKKLCNARGVEGVLTTKNSRGDYKDSPLKLSREGETRGAHAALLRPVAEWRKMHEAGGSADPVWLLKHLKEHDLADASTLKTIEDRAYHGGIDSPFALTIHPQTGKVVAIPNTRVAYDTPEKYDAELLRRDDSGRPGPPRKFLHVYHGPFGHSAIKEHAGGDGYGRYTVLYHQQPAAGHHPFTEFPLSIGRHRLEHHDFSVSKNFMNYFFDPDAPDKSHRKEVVLAKVKQLAIDHAFGKPVKLSRDLVPLIQPHAFHATDKFIRLVKVANTLRTADPGLYKKHLALIAHGLLSPGHGVLVKLRDELTNRGHALAPVFHDAVNRVNELHDEESGSACATCGAKVASGRVCSKCHATPATYDANATVKLSRTSTHTIHPETGEAIPRKTTFRNPWGGLPATTLYHGPGGIVGVIERPDGHANVSVPGQPLKTYNEKLDGGDYVEEAHRDAVRHSHPVKTRLARTVPTPAEVLASFMALHGRKHDGAASTLTLDSDLGKRTAAAFEALKHNPQADYSALKKELRLEYDHMLASGVEVHPWRREGQPYANSKEMAADAHRGHLWYFPTDAGFGQVPLDTTTHPLLEHAGTHAPNGEPQSYNDLLRIVHDYYAHAVHGHQFGPQGELRAWHEHAKMVPPEARAALTTETHGQNSWVNFGPHSHLPVKDRPYAEQKAGELPKEVYPLKLARDGFASALQLLHAKQTQMRVRAIQQLLAETETPGAAVPVLHHHPARGWSASAGAVAREENANIAQLLAGHAGRLLQAPATLQFVENANGPHALHVYNFAAPVHVAAGELRAAGVDHFSLSAHGPTTRAYVFDAAGTNPSPRIANASSSRIAGTGTIYGDGSGADASASRAKHTEAIRRAERAATGGGAE